MTCLGDRHGLEGRRPLLGLVLQERVDFGGQDLKQRLGCLAVQRFIVVRSENAREILGPNTAQHEVGIRHWAIAHIG